MEVQEFKDKAFGLVELTVQNYLSRGFSNLMVSFGCTGGQHRSVYMAENLSRYLKETLLMLKSTYSIENVTTGHRTKFSGGLKVINKK